MNITTGSNDDTVNVLATGVPTSLSTLGGNDTVNVGNAGSVQSILAPLTIQNPGGFTAIHADNSADATARTVFLSTFSSGGADWGSITGLAPAAIVYKYADTSNVNVTTGLGNDTVNVLATGRTTNVSSGGGSDTVNVGAAGSVQGILATLNIQNPHGHDTLNVDDSTDTTARSVGMGTNGSGGSTISTISGLAPATIQYSNAGTGVVNVTTGSGSDQVQVFQTSVPTNLSTSGGLDTIGVGNFGNVQGILATLAIQNPPSFDTINVDDSVDTVGRTATLSTFDSGGVSWGSITGLAPAAIRYKYADVFGVNVTTGLGNDTVNVLATGKTTNLTSAGGRDTVNVGNAGSLQGILGALNIQNPPSLTTININDSADAAARVATLSKFNSANADWGSITGLAPAAINFKFVNTSSPVNITTAVGRVSWVVFTDALASVTGVAVIDDGSQIN